MASETDRRTLDTRYDIAAPARAEIDAGLRAYMLRIYNYMASGLFLSGLVALLVANTSARELFFQVAGNGRVGLSGLGLIGIFAPIGLLLAMNFGYSRMQASTMQALYWLFSATQGIGLSVVLMIYTGVSVTRVFFVTAIAFGSLSLYGYLTKRNLTGFGTF